ncbi:MAG: hypothetical protein AAB610_02265 [Patescibacteria group bacterium]
MSKKTKNKTNKKKAVRRKRRPQSNLVFSYKPEEALDFLNEQFLLSQSCVERKKMEEKIKTVVKYRVLWQGMHDSYTKEFEGALKPQEIAQKALPEVVSFTFTIIKTLMVKLGGKDFENQEKLVESSGVFHLGGEKYEEKGKMMILTRHRSHTFFGKKDVILQI